MFALEVPKTCPIQWKSLLVALGEVDPSESKLITFDMKNGEPHMPSTITFQIPVSIWNLVVHRCIVDEGASMCVMSTLFWQKLGSPILQLSSTTLWAYDGHPTKSQGILPHVPITLARKTFLIDIEEGNAQLDYKLLLGRSYMYAMRAVTSTVFHLMMFSHEGNIVMVDQLRYHDLQGLIVPTNVIPTITTIELQGVTTHANVILTTNTVVENTTASPPLNVGLGSFTNPTMMAPFPLLSPPLSHKG